MDKYDNFFYRPLERDGKCSHCHKRLLKNTERAICFINKKAHYDNVALCENCVRKLIEAFNGDKL